MILDGDESREDAQGELTLEEALAMRGRGWAGDLEATRETRTF